MNVQINQLVKSFLQKDAIEQCSLQELQQFADTYPYFGAAQLLLTKKIQTEKPELYDAQLQKTYLFFHSPLWVNQLLNDAGTATITTSEKKEEEQEAVTPVNNYSLDPIQNETIEQAEKTEETPFAQAETSLPQIETSATGNPVVKPGATLKEENDPIFEPYYTVDYFASQGIKPKEDDRPKDKFDQQLKSFTDWLKTLKRLPVFETETSAPSGLESKVNEMAEYSVADREIITETMAAVWEKQGNKAKAIETYTKLSLLNPSKMAYFAAKIEEVKKLMI